MFSQTRGSSLRGVAFAGLIPGLRQLIARHKHSNEADWSGKERAFEPVGMCFP
jgi:hypothetical protein